MWLSAVVLLLGAQISAKMETQTGHNTLSGSRNRSINVAGCPSITVA